MPKARNKQERAQQALHWCKANWPCGRTVSLVWVDSLYDVDLEQFYDGETERVGRELLITLSRRAHRTWREVVDTVLHEYTHCLQWPIAGPVEYVLDDHPPVFWTQFGELKDRWDHDSGAEDATEYPVK